MSPGDGPTVVVSYDDTANDRDALALGGVLARAGGRLALAYVRHPPAGDGREALEEAAARALLRRGAEALGLPGAPCHVVHDASTGEGLRALAERERAAVVVFGSDYRTAPGEVRPGTAAQQLLEGGPVAVALAPAGLRERAPLTPARIGLLVEAVDAAATATAERLAAAFGAVVVGPWGEPPQLLVVASREEAQPSRVALGAAARGAVESVGCPVLVLARGVEIAFAGAGGAAVG